jgi:hypothetical protein
VGGTAADLKQKNIAEKKRDENSIASWNQRRTEVTTSVPDCHVIGIVKKVYSFEIL